MSDDDENKDESEGDNGGEDNIKKGVVIVSVVLIIGILAYVAVPYVTSYGDEDEGGIERLNYINATEDTTVVVFHTDCPQCDRTLEYVNNNVSNYDNVEVKSYNVSKFGDNEENRTLYKESIERYGVGVPAIQVNNKTWFGYTDTVKSEVRNEIKYCSDTSDGCGVPDTHIVDPRNY